MVREISDKRLTKILELSKQLAVENDFSKRIRLISETIKETLKIDRCTIFLHDEDSKSMWSIYIDGVSYIEVPDDKGVIGKAYKTKKIIILNDIQSDSPLSNNIDKCSGYTAKSILAIPIIDYSGDVLGVMELINKLDKNKGFTKEDEKILGYVMGHISAYLEVMAQGK